MKTNKGILFTIILALIFIHANSQELQTGDLRNNPKTGKLEIFLNGSKTIYLLDTTIHLKNANDYLLINKVHVNGWFDVDSLYSEHPAGVSYGGWEINLQQIQAERKRFRLYWREFMEEKVRKKK
jgi:hypothetical protein